MAGVLEPAQRAQLHEAAHVEAVGGRVEAGVDREPGLVERLGRSESVTWWIRPRKVRSSESVGMPRLCHTQIG